MVEIRFVPLLVALGACLASGILLEDRGLGSKDTSDKAESGLVERDGEIFAAQHPLARPNDNLDGKISIDLNQNTFHHPIDMIESSAEQDPQSEDNHADIHPILKRDPGFITFTRRIFTPIPKIQIVGIASVVTRRTGGLVTVTAESSDVQTVTSLVGKLQTITEFFTESGIVYQVTIPPPSATEEFLTSTYVDETLGCSVPSRILSIVPVTLRVPGTETITEGLRFVTVTSTVTVTRTARATIFIPVSTAAIGAPGACACPEPTTTAGSQ